MPVIISKILKQIFSFLIILVIFVLLFLKVNFSGVVNIIKTVDINLLIICFAISIISSVIIGSERLRYILHILGCSIHLGETIFMKMGSLPLRMLPSGKIDLVSEIVYLKKYKNFSIFSGLHALILGLIFNIFAQLIFFFSGFIFFIFLKKNDQILIPVYIFYIAIFIVCLSVVFWVCLRSGKIQKVILPVVKNININLHDKFIKLISIYQGLDSQKLIYLLLYSIVFEFLEIIVCYILARSLGLYLPFYSIVLLIPIVILVTNLPLTFGGIGVREVMLLYFFSRYGSAEQVLSMGMIYSFSEYIIPMLIGLLFMKSFLHKLL
jgi:uncharacterized protein (TIRG00374 family)